MSEFDRLSARRGDDAFLAWLFESEAARIIPLVGTKLVIRSNAERTSATLFHAPKEALSEAGARLTVSDLLFIGVERDPGTQDIQRAIFAYSFSPDEALSLDPNGDVLAPAVDLRSLAMQDVLSAVDMEIAATATALSSWHEVTRYCGRCGGATRAVSGGWSRTCTNCAQVFFPRTDPVVIMLVTAGDHCILARQPHFPEGMMSALAGFVEPGEIIEAAVSREVEEEVGVKINSARYLASQSWPFPHSLMIACMAEADRQPLQVEPTELESAGWFSRLEVRQMLEGCHPDRLWVPGPHAIARRLAETFANSAD